MNRIWHLRSVLDPKIGPTSERVCSADNRSCSVIRYPLPLLFFVLFALDVFLSYCLRLCGAMLESIQMPGLRSTKPPAVLCDGLGAAKIVSTSRPLVRIASVCV